MLSWKRVVSLSAMFSAVALLALAAPEAGRRGAGGSGLDPAVRSKAISVVAKCVAKDVGLAAEKTEKFVAAYSAEREAATKRMMEMMKSGDREKFATVSEENRKAMDGVLEANLTAEQAKKAKECDLEGLERSVGMLLAAKVDDAKIDQALPLLAKYHKTSAALRAKAQAENMSREDMMAKDKDLREAAAKDLAPIIGDEVAKKWQETRFFGFGGGARPGGGGKPAGGGKRAAPKAPAP